MAALLRVVLRRCCRLPATGLGPLPAPASAPAARLLTGSASTPGSASASALAGPQDQALGFGDGEQPEVNLYDKYPEYHGFSSDPVSDLWNMRMAFFFGISLAIVMGSAFVHYLPDRGMRQWARREAERRLKHLETQGLPPIAENYYDTEKIVLPPSGSE
ncbi:NADH dehydrogenase [ubiquinone] 1 beta subcomplex subunit 11, mitochondrial [Scyliorhinus canicula]|uniref:NADH dehydrogenase [ubiquinone] 1 beta subcomplex subunit 11, mitochondrial n=1 Tax=Scyliorhinus canicula TaxID=7830 RepID=UPI0018F52944|nr:NADH dehydrogenase [ubiquinone] 1 beta subcomplex subunit 11, mitochondrial [Scyliorhinus canicula]